MSGLANARRSPWSFIRFRARLEKKVVVGSRFNDYYTWVVGVSLRTPLCGNFTKTENHPGGSNLLTDISTWIPVAHSIIVCLCVKC